MSLRFEDLDELADPDAPRAALPVRQTPAALVETGSGQDGLCDDLVGKLVRASG